MADRRAFSPTELAQLARCEQQLLFDRARGTKRSAAWRQRSSEGQREHERLHRRVTGRRPDDGLQGIYRMLIYVLAAIGAALFLFIILGQKTESSHDALLPSELQGAQLALSEKTLVRKRPVHVRGRPDEVWLKNGRRVIVETKTRSGRVFEGDRMQLAAYAYLLRGDGGPPLAPYGFIRFTGEGISFAKVKLRDDDAVIDAHRRLQKLTKGREEPRFASSAALCKGCGHRDLCPAVRAA